MQRIGSVLLAITVALPLSAQVLAPPPPQSARQALIEMFFGTREDDFAKHLPEAARQTLIRKGENPETSVALRISAIGRQVVAQGQHLETFDTGSTLLVTEPAKGEKIEVMVESDSLHGDQEEIELSVHYYKDGQLQPLPVVPLFTFAFQQQREIWRLLEVTAAAHVPLTDPDYLKGLRRQQDESYESSAQMRMNAIMAAETRYAAKYPGVGYSCALTSLFSREVAGTPGEGPFLFDPGQGNDEWNGYRFTLSGCEGSPVLKFRVLAAPIDPDSEAKTFCADESGSLKFVSGGKSSACFTRGQPLATGSDAGGFTE